MNNLNDYFKKYEKPNWDIYFLSQAFLVSQKSIDPRTRHGACWVSKDNNLLSIGYNGPVSNSNDEKIIPYLNTKLKYGIMIHAEENAILNYNGSKSDCEGSTMYITGNPCHKCLRMMIQQNIKKIVCGEVGSKCLDSYDNEIKSILLEDHDIEFVEYNSKKIKEMFYKTLDYINIKC